MTQSIWDLPFMKHVQPEPNSGCWIWTAACTTNGYPQQRHNNKMIRVHRELFQLLKSPIPNGMQLDHLCRIRCCVNPDHLEIVTPAENARRGAGCGGKLPATYAPPKYQRQRLLQRVRSKQRQFLSRKFQTNARQKSLL